MKPALIVHGGCGTPPAGEEAARNEACERAADAGWAVLRRAAAPSTRSRPRSGASRTSRC